MMMMIVMSGIDGNTVMAVKKIAGASMMRTLRSAPARTSAEAADARVAEPSPLPCGQARRPMRPW